jgi:hypothetical protein
MIFVNNLFYKLVYLETHPTQTANKRPQVSQKRPYVGSPTLTIFVIATLYGHSG